MISEVKTSDQSYPTEIQLFSQLITESYDGENARISNITQFIQSNVEKGSKLANDGYTALLNAMGFYDQLYLKNNISDVAAGSGIIDYKYRTMIAIREAEGDASPVLSQVPSVVNTILSGKKMLIRNSVTNDLLCAPRGDSSNNVTNVRVVNVHGTNHPRFIWKLKPVEYRWKQYNMELFYIENTQENKLLSVAGDDGSLELVKATEEKLKSTWTMFYIQLVRGSTGQEVAIQCSFWGLKTLTLDGKLPKLVWSSTLDDIPTGIWYLQPKEE